MFKDLLKSAMDVAGMNATALSAATGIGKSSISQYLSGKIVPPDKKKEHIALSMGLEADYFKKSEVKADIEINSSRMTVEQTAALMHKRTSFVRKGLQDGVFPFGYAVKVSGHYSYFISKAKFTECTGIPV